MARGDIFYEAWVEYPRADYYKTDEQRRVYVTARWTREEAEAKLAEFVRSQTARGYAPERSWVEEKRVETDFEIPDLATGAVGSKPYQAIHHGDFKTSVWINGRLVERSSDPYI